ncbi:hypothetical protein N7468_003452 [Penicillium chermesinum]|uniref:Uncharacterized protein n=1 Tax=Penicillium chermesinum TaxID=63820 RepID=A0A9W9P6I4_9EURO|nr:uncharacterized protein N7468_003452 [Penicillium chermesinum]KAJ5238833.1 hypothetical protein N7468_003452 [Penicillium chermesinum]KAJ6164470.1 hypothetical protein N7470_003142 [Penicillium chermesinum]
MIMLPDLDDVVRLTISVEDTASVECAGLDLSFPAEPKQSVRVLCGFEKVTVAPGKTGQAGLTIWCVT